MNPKNISEYVANYVANRLEKLEIENIQNDLISELCGYGQGRYVIYNCESCDQHMIGDCRCWPPSDEYSCAICDKIWCINCSAKVKEPPVKYCVNCEWAHCPECPCWL